MRIVRTGAQHDHGPASSNAPLMDMSWQEGAIFARAWSVPDFSTYAQHHWQVSIPIEEFAAMINAAADGLKTTHAPRICGSLASSFGALLKLAEAIAVQHSLVPKQSTSGSSATNAT